MAKNTRRSGPAHPSDILEPPDVGSAGREAIIGAGERPYWEGKPPSHAGKASQEAADDYQDEIVRLNDRWRVIVCKDGIQWILQRRDAGGSHAARWRGRSYATTRKALMRLCGSLCEAPDEIAMVAIALLPERLPRAKR